MAPIWRSPARDAVGEAWPWSLAAIEPTKQININILSRTETLLEHWQAFEKLNCSSCCLLAVLLLWRLIDVEIDHDRVLNTIAGGGDCDWVVVVEVAASAP